jgi:hypothetical protein
MSKLLILVFSVFATSLLAQPCMPNDTVTTTVYPSPEVTPGVGGIGEVACIGQPFNFVWTFNIPNQFTASGITAGLDSIVIATAGAVKNLPGNLSYSCNPPNCIFKAFTKGCIELSGSVVPSIPVGDIELLIAVMIHGKAFGQPLVVPADIPNPAITGPGKYILRVRDANSVECTVSTNDFDFLNSVKMSPVPASQYLNLEVDAIVGGDYQLQVTNTLGQVLNQKIVALSSGSNTMELDLSNMQNGSYQLTLSKEGHVVAYPFVVAK